MSSQKKHCQGCSRHCPLDDLRCGRGRKLLRQMQEAQGQLSLLDRTETHQGKPGRHRHENPDRPGNPDAIAALDAPLERKITLMLRFLGRAVGKGTGKQVRMRLLMLLRQTAGLRMNAAEAAMRLGVAETDVRRMMRKLEHSRLVHCAEEDVSSSVRLSKPGVTATARWMQTAPNGSFSGYEGLTPEDRQQLYDLLQKLSRCTPWQAAGKA